MKFILLAMTLVFSSALMAKTPATEAVENVIKSGTYEGRSGSQKCTVTVATSEKSFSVVVAVKGTNTVFSFSNNSPKFSYNQETSVITATQSLNYPHYLQGGTQILSIVPDDIEQTEVSITSILLDHRGNDASTYTACTIVI